MTTLCGKCLIVATHVHYEALAQSCACAERTRHVAVGFRTRAVGVGKCMDLLTVVRVYEGKPVAYCLKVIDDMRVNAERFGEVALIDRPAHVCKEHVSVLHRACSAHADQIGLLERGFLSKLGYCLVYCRLYRLVRSCITATTHKQSEATVVVFDKRHAKIRTAYVGGEYHIAVRGGNSSSMHHSLIIS